MANVTIGLVVPHPTDTVPAEGPIMYPGVTFVPHRTGVASLTPEGYEAAADKIIPAADNLAKRGVDAIMVIGTSLTFWRGPAFNDHLMKEIPRRTGLPTSTMSTAIVEGLRAVGARTLAVATAYTEVVNDRLRALLSHHGFDVGALKCFNITEFGDGVIRRSEEQIIELSSQSYGEAPDADAILISCGGLRTLNVAQPLERRHGRAVVSSTPAAFWAAMGLVGHSGRIDGYGRLLAEVDAPAAAA